MPARTSRSRIESSRNSSRFASTGSAAMGEELAFLVCDAYEFGRRKLKSNERLSQEMVEQCVRKKPRSRPNHYEMFLLEDRIRFKPKHVTLRAYAHPTVIYNDIKGAFSVVERPNWLVLGIHYGRQNCTKLECFYIPREEDANRAKDLLLLVKNNEQGLLHGVRPVGTVSCGSTRMLSRPISFGGHQIAETKYDLVDDVFTPGIDKLETRQTRATSPIPNLTSSVNGKRQMPHVSPNGRDIYKSMEYGFDEEEIHVNPYQPVKKEVCPLRRTQLVYEADNRVHYADKRSHFDNERRRSSYNSIFNLDNEEAGSLIFINNTPSRGIYVSDDGPVYMFCHIEH